MFTIYTELLRDIKDATEGNAECAYLNIPATADCEIELLMIRYACELAYSANDPNQNGLDGYGDILSDRDLCDFVKGEFDYCDCGRKFCADNGLPYDSAMRERELRAVKWVGNFIDNGFC